MSTATDFACLCGDGMGKLGLAPCFTDSKLTEYDIFVRTYANDNTRNSIPASAIVNGKISEQYIIDMLDHADPSKRWYLTPKEYEEVAPARTDRQTSEGRRSITTLRSGVGTFEAEIWGIPSNWSANLNKNACNEWSHFPVGENNSLEGELSSDKQDLYPIRLEKSSLFAEPFGATNDKQAYTKISYQNSSKVNEGCLIALTSEVLGGDLTDARSPIGINLVDAGSHTATEIFVNASNYLQGTFGNPYELTGATAFADWTVLDKNTLAPIAVATAEELADGQYKLTIPSTPTTEVLVSYIKSRTSLSDLGFISDQITITTGA